MTVMVVFVSYAREDREAVDVLRHDIERSRRKTWMDEELDGGEAWWVAILEQIRACSAFVFVVSPDSLVSRACRAELSYALALGRPLLPIMVRKVDLQQTVDAVADAQVVDYSKHTPNAAIALVTALSSLPLPPPLPSPLPVSPPPPVTHLGGIRQRLDAETLSYLEQRDVLSELRSHLSVQEDQGSVAELLRLLRRRQDVAETVAAEIDPLLSMHVLNGRSDGDVQRFVRWPSLVSLIRMGKCTPVLGQGLTDTLIGPRRLLARRWADEFSFPLARHQIEDLPQVAQYVRVKNDEITLRAALGEYIRRQVVERFPSAVPRDLGSTRLDDMITMAWQQERSKAPTDPHTFLADLPLSIYITAHPCNLLSEALRTAGREPVIELCRWRADVDDWPDSAFRTGSDYEPSVERPLVFHLFGNLDFPDSLVITEDDYFDFLIGTSLNRALIPPPVQHALTDSALVFLGFRLEEWDFRVLLRSLLSQEGAHRRRRYSHVAAQLDVGDGVVSPERARSYLSDYFNQFKETSIDIFWGTVDQFVMALEQQWSVAA